VALGTGQADISQTRLSSFPTRVKDVLARAEREGGVVVCPRIVSTELDGLICKTPLVVEAPSVSAQRITSSAWKRRVGGIVIPRAFAVLRLMTSSNVVGCSMGRSAGLAPFRILST
jgi:hypothetical protein